jgi:hypothetical protein
MNIGYYCKHCDFYGKTKFFINQHLTTKKHILLSNNDTCFDNYNKLVYNCNICNKIYSSKSNINKHINNAHKMPECKPEKKNTTDKFKDVIIDMALKTEDKKMGRQMVEIYIDSQLQKKDLEIEFTTKIKDIYENENEFHKKVAVNAGEMVNKTMNMFTYAMKNFKETPKLEMLDSNIAKKLLKYESTSEKIQKELNDDEIAEYIARISEAKILPKHLGKTLVSYYKKEDPNRQSLWTTDINRMKFITKSDDGWLKDNNGDIINRNIIIPLLKEVVKVMDKYCNDRMKHIDKMTHNEEAKYVEVSEQRINIKSNIINEKLNKAIIKQIAPYLIMQKQLK